ncbi:MAG: glycosyltransferase family 9 protein [Bacteroidota bacterium]
MDRQKAILIIQTAFIGDLILATPIIEKMARFYPDYGLDILVRKGNESLLVEHPHIRNVIIWNKKEDKYKNWWQILKQIQKERYEYLINVQRFFSTGMLAMLSRAKHIIGFDKNPLSFSFTSAIKHEIGQGKHEVERNLSLISALTDDSFQRPVLHPPTASVEKVAPYQQEPYVCMAPTSVWFTKQMPAQKWVELISMIPASYTVYLLGAPSDHEACENIRRAAAHSSVVNLAGKLSLIDSVQLISLAAMTYVNDSAPMHMASSVNAPTTAFFCSTVPSFGFGPLADIAFLAETNRDLSCRPCGLHGKKACPLAHFDCGYHISFDKQILPGQA